MSTSQKLMQMKSEIESTKTDLAKEEGKLEELTKKLKTDFKITSIKEAKKLIEQFDNEIIEKEKELENGVKALEEDYEW